MMMSRKSKVATLIRDRIDSMEKAQNDIARECGWKPNVITMIKDGLMKVPLCKVGPLAVALGWNPAFLFYLVLTEYAPDTLRAIESTMTGIVINPHEQRVVAAYRQLVGDSKIAKEVEISDGNQSIRVTVEM